jgi:hypothetical protein
LVLHSCIGGKNEGEFEMSEKEGNDLKRITWQGENCISCKWFFPNDPLNADILERGKCLEPTLKKFELIVSGRDWCNKFEVITQRQIDALQERAMSKESKEK